MIRNFFNDFSRQQNAASEIKTDIEKVSAIQSTAAAEICKKLKEQLDGYKLEDCNDTKSEQEVYSNSCRIIEDKLDYLAGTDQYTIYKNKRDKLFANLDRSKREKTFLDALETLKGLLNSNMLAQEKIERIDRFEADYSADFKYKRVQEFRELAEARKRYTREAEWAKIDEDLVRPDENDENSLIRYREKCESLMAKALQYKEDSYLKFKVEQKRNKAQDEIHWVEKQIGDGTFADIREKEKEYKNDPLSVANYTALKLALKAFDPEKTENKAHKEEVEDIRKRSEGYHGIVQKFNCFVSDPKQTNWMAFSNEVMKQGASRQGEYPGYPVKYFDIGQALYRYVGDGPMIDTPITITLKAWNFKGTKFYRWGKADCRVWISKTHQERGDLYCNGMPGGNWNEDDRSYKKTTDRKLFVEIPAKSVRYIQFANTNGSDVFSQQIPLTIYKILVEARRDGKCSIDLPDTAPGGGSITLEFSGLPKF